MKFHSHDVFMAAQHSNMCNHYVQPFYMVCKELEKKKNTISCRGNAITFQMKRYGFMVSSKKKPYFRQTGTAKPPSEPRISFTATRSPSWTPSVCCGPGHATITYHRCSTAARSTYQSFDAWRIIRKT